MDEDDGNAVYVCIVVDVDGVIAAFPGDDTPRLLDDDGDRVVVTTTASIDEPASAAITVNANAGDLVRVYAISGSCNFESAVLLDGVHATHEPDGEDDGVVGRFTFVTFEQIPVVPEAKPLTLAATPAEQQFTFWQASILSAGTQPCVARLALYGRDERGQPQFSGLYRWAFALTVNLSGTDNNAEQGGMS